MERQQRRRIDAARSVANRVRPLWYGAVKPRRSSVRMALSGSAVPTPIQDEIAAPMKLPGAHRAAVDRAKVTDYLLNATHPDNGGKAAFFSRLGFSRKHWRVLADALRAQAAEAEIIAAVASPHGEKYIVETRLRTPAGRTPVVRSVWIIDRGSDAPRLVTAYPAREDSQ